MRKENPKVIVVHPHEGQTVLVKPEFRNNPHRQSVREMKITIQPTALERLDELIADHADELTAILGTDIDAKRDLAIDLQIGPLFTELKEEGRKNREVLNRIYQTLREAGKRAGESEDLTKLKARKLYRILRQLSQGEARI